MGSGCGIHGMSRFSQRLQGVFIMLIKSILIFALLGLGSSSYAGWNSGGGELVRDRSNPWFLENTEEVRYCVQLDEANFHQDREVVEEKIQRAFEYWRSEFSHAVYAGEDDDLKIATQRFVPGPCTADVAIRFQMGFLTPEQLAKIPNPRQFVSMAVRESYDTRNMAGKGFVYLAADSGPLRPEAPDMLSMPWQSRNGYVLEGVLIHELGHVFGIGHHGMRQQLMSPGFPEMLVKTREWAEDSRPEIPNFIRYMGGKGLVDGFCGNGESYYNLVAKFFGFSPTVQGVLLTAHDDLVDVEVVPKMKMQSDCFKSDPRELVGTIELTGQSIGGLDPIVTVYLPPEQTVFPTEKKEARYVNVLAIRLDRVGTYRAKNGSVTRKVLVHLSPDLIGSKIAGVMDGDIIPNVMEDSDEPAKN